MMRRGWELQEVTIRKDNVIFSKERTEGVVAAKERTFELYNYTRDQYQCAPYEVFKSN